MCKWSHLHQPSEWFHVCLSPWVYWTQVCEWDEWMWTRSVCPWSLYCKSVVIRNNYWYCIRTYFCGVHIFAIFANESQTAKINTRENLSCHCFAACIRPTAISGPQKPSRTWSHSYWRVQLHRMCTFRNSKNRNPWKFSLSVFQAIREKLYSRKKYIIMVVFHLFHFFVTLINELCYWRKLCL